MEACVPVTVIHLTRSRNADGELVVRLGARLLDEYLEFLAGRCRPNTVAAVAYDLKVFFTWWASRRGGSARWMCWRL
jgi:hypothetical protein